MTARRVALDHPTRSAPERWHLEPAGVLKVGDVAYDPVVGRWLLNPSGNSRLAEILAVHPPEPGAEPAWITFEYHDINEPSFRGTAWYTAEEGLRIWR